MAIIKVLFLNLNLEVHTYYRKLQTLGMSDIVIIDYGLICAFWK